MADNDLSGPGEKLKKYFYALRPFLAILRVAKNEDVPPEK
jgi:predicted nucleotidyltransferase